MRVTISKPSFLAGLLLTSMVSSQFAYAVGNEGTELRHLDKKNSLKGLKWKSGVPAVESRPFGEEIKYFAILEGKFTSATSSLVISNKPIMVNARKEFKLELPLTAKLTQFDAIVINQTGDLKREKLAVFFPGWTEFTKKQAEAPPKQNFFSVGANISIINYTDERVPSVSETALTGKFSYSRLIFPPTIDMGLSTYFTLVPLHASNGQSLRFIGVNGRIGYVVPQVKEPWRLSLMGGVYFATMVVQQTGFGYTNLIGPQFFPVARRKLNSGDIAVMYFKYSPVSNGGFTITFANHEIAGGGSYVHPLANGKSIAGTLDISSLDAVIEGVKIHTGSFSFGAAYGF